MTDRSPTVLWLALLLTALAPAAAHEPPAEAAEPAPAPEELVRLLPDALAPRPAAPPDAAGAAR